VAVPTKCSLLLYDGQEGVCHRCGRPLSGRKTRWCSKDCEDRYWEAHYWPLARKAALRRAHHRCERCGSAEGVEVNHISPVLGRGYNKSCLHHPLVQPKEA
jgi:predicted amidophosphoribosyltransferase